MLPAGALSGKRILIIHYRVGRTDGVSIEISSWKQIFERCGAEVALCSGPINIGADYEIQELEHRLGAKIFNLGNLVLGRKNNINSEKDIIRISENYQKNLENKFPKVIKSFKPTNIVVSNLFSHGGHVPAAIALTNVIDKHKIPTISVEHDFYWDVKAYKNLKSRFILQALEEYHPPKRSYINHVTINSLTKKKLKEIKNVDSEILHDTLDFGQPLWKRGNKMKKFLSTKGVRENDLIILQATRVVERKQIEISVNFVKNLNSKKLLKKLSNNSLYNNKKFNPQKDKIILLLSGRPEKSTESYFKKLIKYAKLSNINCIYIGNKIKSYESSPLSESFGLTDVYPFADLITYPSRQEGFGNQFLEALFARKPVLIYEYPVFKSDLKPKGFKVISLGDKVSIDSEGLAKIPKKKLDSATIEAAELLTDKTKYKSLVDGNFQLGTKHFSYDKAFRVFYKLLV